MRRFLNENFSKYLELLKLGSATALIQMALQLIGFASSILIIRILSQEQYGFYTMTYTFFGIMTVLADGGISNGIMAQGGKVWKESAKLSAVLATGMQLRRQFGAAVVIVIIPLHIFFLRKLGADWDQVLYLNLALLPLLYIELSKSLLTIIPRLHQEILPMQRIGIYENLLRFVIVLAVLFTLPFAAVVIGATAIANGWGNLRLGRLCKRICPVESPANPEVRGEVLKVVKRVLPESIYFCISGSLSIWLISIFGETQQVAEVGALDRIAKLMTLFTAVFSILIIPRFARLPENAAQLLKAYGLIIFLAASIAMAVFCGIWLFPNTVLSLIGPDYAGLTEEIRLRALLMAIAMVGAVTNSMTLARGWVVHPAILIPGQLIAQIAGIIVFDCSTVSGVILVMLLPSIFKQVAKHLNALYMIRKTSTKAH